MNTQFNPPKTIRFWQYINGSPVRLKLRAGQSLTHSHFSRTDEGWSSEQNIWSFDGHILSTEIINDGRDCDGRLTQYGSFVATAIEGIKDCEFTSFNGKPIHYPIWETIRSGQRDQYAEAAGY